MSQYVCIHLLFKYGLLFNQNLKYDIKYFISSCIDGYQWMCLYHLFQNPSTTAKFNILKNIFVFASHEDFIEFSFMLRRLK